MADESFSELMVKAWSRDILAVKVYWQGFLAFYTGKKS